MMRASLSVSIRWSVLLAACQCSIALSISGYGSRGHHTFYRTANRIPTTVRLAATETRRNNLDDGDGNTQNDATNVDDWVVWSENSDSGVVDLDEEHLMFLDDDDDDNSDGDDEESVMADEGITDHELSWLFKGTNDTMTDEDQSLRDYTIAIDNLHLLPNASNVPYFYLQNELGMLPEDMWKITYEAGNVLGLTADNIRKKVRLLRQTMALNDEELRTIIRLSPTILYLSPDKNVGPTILFLQRQLDLSRTELKSLVVQRPYILSYSIPNLGEKIKFFTKVMSFTVEETRKLLIKQPQLMSCGVTGGLFPRMKFLVREIGFKMKDLRKLVMKNPGLLLKSVESNLQPKLIFYLIMTLHMDTADVRKVLTRLPHFVEYNLDNHILPISQFLTTEVEYTNIELRSIILKFPGLFTHSLQKVKTVVGYFRFELGMNPDRVRRILYQAPQLVSLSLDNNVKVKVERLRETFGYDESEMRKLISGMPTLLLCSWDNNLSPKIDYLANIMGTDQLAKALLAHPSILGYSLTKRIIPRMEAALGVGIPPNSIGTGLPRSQTSFEKWLVNKSEMIRKDALRNEDGIILPEEYEPKDQYPDGRIQHWDRDRRRQPPTP